MGSSREKGSGSRLWLDVDAAPLLAEAQTMTIAIGKSKTSLALPEIKPALAALKACQDDLLSGWGVDPRERDHIGDQNRSTPDSIAARAALLDKEGKPMTVHIIRKVDRRLPE